MNRREFFKIVALATISARFTPHLLANADVPLDPNLVAIFADTHVTDGKKKRQVGRFKMCVGKILAMNPRPATLLIYGDIVVKQGEVELYKKFRRLMEPIEKAGIKWEVAMGNHDRLDDYRTACPDRFAEKPILEDRYIHIVETPRADFILLDSYQKDHVDGIIEPAQKKWLAETLKKYTEKPVFVGCHHGLHQTKIGKILHSCPKVAAYLHGHWHWWKNSQTDDGIPMICFPSVGQRGDMGFVMCHLGENEATFVPEIDAYLAPKKKSKRPPVTDVEAYLKKLKEASVTVPLK